MIVIPGNSIELDNVESADIEAARSTLLLLEMTFDEENGDGATLVSLGKINELLNNIFDSAYSEDQPNFKFSLTA